MHSNSKTGSASTTLTICPALTVTGAFHHKNQIAAEQAVSIIGAQPHRGVLVVHRVPSYPTYRHRWHEKFRLRRSG